MHLFLHLPTAIQFTDSHETGPTTTTRIPHHGNSQNFKISTAYLCNALHISSNMPSVFVKWIIPQPCSNLLPQSQCSTVTLRVLNLPAHMFKAAMLRSNATASTSTLHVVICVTGFWVFICEYPRAVGPDLTHDQYTVHVRLQWSSSCCLSGLFLCLSRSIFIVNEPLPN